MVNLRLQWPFVRTGVLAIIQVSEWHYQVNRWWFYGYIYQNLQFTFSTLILDSWDLISVDVSLFLNISVRLDSSSSYTILLCDLISFILIYQFKYHISKAIVQSKLKKIEELGNYDTFKSLNRWGWFWSLRYIYLHELKYVFITDI